MPSDPPDIQAAPAGQFIAHDLTATFVQDLRDDRDALDPVAGAQ